MIHRVGGIAIDHEVECTIGALAPELIARFNFDFTDTVVLIGRALTPHRDATAARFVGLDPIGIDLEITEFGRTHYHRVEYPTPIDHPSHICIALCALVRAARERAREADASRDTNGVPPIGP